MDQHDLKQYRAAAPRMQNLAQFKKTAAAQAARIAELEAAARGTISIEKSAELVQLNIAAVVEKYAPVENALRARIHALESALRAIVAITDGSQPKDYPGALMVARAALES